MELEYVPVQVAMRREIARLSDEEAGRALKAILDYVATGEDVEPSLPVQGAWIEIPMHG